MRISREKFAKLIKAEFANEANSKNKKLRTDRTKLKTKRDRLYKKYIEPLDEGMKFISSELNRSCEHPTELVDVKIEGWRTDDGEGNVWSGDTVKITCKSCGLKVDIESNSDGSHGPRYKTSEDQIGKANLNKLWNQVVAEIDKDNRELHRKYEEEQERKQYQRLKEKYG